MTRGKEDEDFEKTDLDITFEEERFNFDATECSFNVVVGNGLAYFINCSIVLL